MVKFIPTPSIIKAAGTVPKEIREFFGRVNSGTSDISIAHMKSPQGWEEPGQRPAFDEYTLVLKGILNVETKTDTLSICAGQAIMISKDEWVKYATPHKGGAEYIAVCTPAFSVDIVNRDLI
jgi:mannose-6-phosphate isomerase-like protein (cupin superfamily)